MVFEMVGKISLGKETDKFKPYSEHKYDSGWVKRRIMFNAICGDNRHLLTVDAGSFADGHGDVYTFSKGSVDDNFDWNTAVIPQVNVDKPQSPQQGANIAIINQNKTSEEVYGSYEFIKYLVSTEVNTKWTMNTGYLPIRQSVLDSQEYQDYLATVKGNVKVNGTTAS